VNVSWFDAVAYCAWLSEKTGKSYHLPTEAEWEKAARGEDGRVYVWGDEWDETKANSMEGEAGDTTPVGHYSPDGDSPYGCADMAGNVWEWCHSLDRPYPYNLRDGREAPETDGPRVLRGGAFLDSERLARCASRNGVRSNFRSRSYGFRVCVAPA